MKFALSLFVICLFFVFARTVAYTYFPENTFFVGWLAGSVALMIGQYFE